MNANRWPLMLLVVFGFVGNASAQESPKVAVQIWTIRATRSNDEVSPQLKPLVKALQNSFKFSGYKLVRSETREVELKKTVTSSLTGPFKVKVTPTEKAEGRITLQVEVTERQGDRDVRKLNTVVALKPERFQLFGGWKLEKEDVLIVAVSAK